MSHRVSLPQTQRLLADRFLPHSIQGVPKKVSDKTTYIHTLKFMGAYIAFVDEISDRGH